MTQSPEQPEEFEDQGLAEGQGPHDAAPAPGGADAPGSDADPVDVAEQLSETVVEGEPPSDEEDAGEQAAADELAVARMEAAERLADLQRLQAEFVNYKRRVERDREMIKQNATYAALAPIVEVLDTIDRAREHEPLDGGFKAVAEQLERTVAGSGLTKFGAVGDAFDPTVHEALSHLGEDGEVTVPTCKVVAKSGYAIGDRVVRAAQVLVVDPPA